MILGNCYRADKLIKDSLEKMIKDKHCKAEDAVKYESILAKVDIMKEEELNETIADLKLKSPEKSHELSKVFSLNLMFSTQIGPTGNNKGYLRPETAQGHFVNFKKLYDFNGGKIPFASAMIGLGFRNEISPRAV